MTGADMGSPLLMRGSFLNAVLWKWWIWKIRSPVNLKAVTGIVEGTITVGCGEFMAVEIFARICKIYKEKYPMVRFAVHTGTADTVLK